MPLRCRDNPSQPITIHTAMCHFCAILARTGRNKKPPKVDLHPHTTRGHSLQTRSRSRSEARRRATIQRSTTSIDRGERSQISCCQISRLRIASTTMTNACETRRILFLFSSTTTSSTLVNYSLLQRFLLSPPSSALLSILFLVLCRTSRAVRRCLPNFTMHGSVCELVLRARGCRVCGRTGVQNNSCSPKKTMKGDSQKKQHHLTYSP